MDRSSSTRIVPAEELVSRAVAVCERLAALPAKSFAWTKQLLTRSFLAGMEEHLVLERELNAASAAEPALQEGVRAFLEKRAPKFRTA